jgi:ribosome-binding protein aMBF1 (putative translation factor)
MTENRKKPGQDFEEFMAEARMVPEVAEYLDSFAVHIGNLVLSHRLKKGLSQMELAALLGIAVENLYEIESGFGNVTLNIVEKVYKALDIDLFQPNQ